MPTTPDLIPPVPLLTNKAIVLLPPRRGAKPTDSVPCALLTPLDGVSTPEGYRVDFSVGFVALNAVEIKERTDAVNDLLRSPARPEISVGKIEVLLGNWAIGPNNDLVKIVVAI